MGLNGITYTTADGETINLDSDYISEQESKEIVELRNQEIKDKTFLRHIVQKKYSEDKKNGKVIKWSKQRIWRENVAIAFRSIENIDFRIESLEEAMIYTIYYFFKDIDFSFKELEYELMNIFGTVKDGDSEENIKQKLINKNTIEKGAMPRFSHVYYAFGVKGCEKIYDDKVKFSEMIEREDPLIIRHKCDSILKYRCLDKFYTYDLN